MGRISPGSGVDYESLDLEYLTILNTMRRANGLPNLRLRPVEGQWLGYNTCLSKLNVSRWNQGQATDHANGACRVPVDSGYGAENVGMKAICCGVAMDEVALSLSDRWYRSTGHRQAILSNADWVQITMVTYRTNTGGLVHMGQMQFGVDSGRFQPASTTFGQTTDYGYGTATVAAPLYHDTFHSVDNQGRLVAPRLAPSLAQGWRNPIEPSVEPPLDPENPGVYYRWQTARLFLAFFNRTPDADGWVYWNDRIISHRARLKVIAESFSNSTEFQQRYGTVSNREFIRLMYRNVMDRAPDRDGYDYWLGHLNSGRMTRGDVMAYFSESAEFVADAESRLTGNAGYLAGLRYSQSYTSS